MRLTNQQIAAIRAIVEEEAGSSARTLVFGSRLHDQLRGGDVDLLVTVDDPEPNPAWLVARLEARISRSLGGRSVDVVLAAPNLQRHAIHHFAENEGEPL